MSRLRRRAYFGGSPGGLRFFVFLFRFGYHI
jgi:hypothetical protein